MAQENHAIPLCEPLDQLGEPLLLFELNEHIVFRRNRIPSRCVSLPSLPAPLGAMRRTQQVAQYGSEPGPQRTVFSRRVLKRRDERALCKILCSRAVADQAQRECTEPTGFRQEVIRSGSRGFRCAHQPLQSPLHTIVA